MWFCFEDGDRIPANGETDGRRNSAQSPTRNCDTLATRRLRSHLGRRAAELGAGTLEPPDADGLAAIGTATVRLAGMVANVGQDARKRDRSCQQRQPFFEVTGCDCNGQGASIHVKRAGGRTSGGLLFDALALPPPNLVPIHFVTPDPSCLCFLFLFC